MGYMQNAPIDALINASRAVEYRFYSVRPKRNGNGAANLLPSAE